MKNLLKVLLKRFQRTEDYVVMNLAFMKGRASTPVILLTRIDTKGFTVKLQIQWSSYLGANLLLVANDKVAVIRCVKGYGYGCSSWCNKLVISPIENG